MAQPLTKDATTEDTTTRHAPGKDHRTHDDDQPGPGTLGALRRERELSAPTGRGSGWRVMAVLLVVVAAIAIGYLLGSVGGGAGADGVTNAAEAAVLQDEKAVLAARAPVVAGEAAPDSAGEAAMLQDEKAALLAGSAAVGDQSAADNQDEHATLQAEKDAMAANGQGVVSPDAAEEAAAIAREKAAIADRTVVGGDAGAEAATRPVQGEQGEKQVLLAR